MWKSEIARVISRVHADLADFIADEAEQLKERAQELAPVKTGHLRASIHIEQRDDLTVEVDVGADYGMVVEFGGVHTPAHPFLSAAAAEQGAGLEDRLRKSIHLGA